MKRTQTHDDDESISTNSVVLESNRDQPDPTSADVKRYRVPISRNVEGRLTGALYIYASSKHEAFAKAQAKIDADTVDEDIKMQDSRSFYWMSYEEARQWDGDCIEIDEDEIAVDEDEAEPFGCCCC